MTGQPVEVPSRDLRVDADRLQLALDAGQLGTWHWDAETRKVDFDERQERIFGYAPGEFPGTLESWLERVLPEDRETVIGELESAYHARSGAQGEYRIRWPDGTIRWVEGRGHVALDAAGEVRGFAGVTWDVTDRHRAQEEREREHRRERILARAGHLFATALDVPVRIDALFAAATPELADCCLVYLLDETGHPVLYGARHIDATREEALRQLLDEARVSIDPPYGAGESIRTGTPQLVELMTFAGDDCAGDDCAAEDSADDDSADDDSADDDVIGHVQLARSFGLASSYSVPLITDDRVIGALSFGRTTPRAWSDEDRELADELAARGAVALGNALRYAGEQSARRLIIDLQRITAGLAEATSIEEVGAVVVDHVASAVGTDTALLARVVDGQFHVVASAGLSPDSVRVWEGIAREANTPPAHVLRTREPLFFTDRAQLDEHFPGATVVGPHEAYTVLPLIKGDRTVGVIRLAWRRPHPFAPGDQEFLLSVAQQAASALDRAELLAAEQSARAFAEESHRRLSLLAEVTHRLSSTLDVNTALRRLAGLAVPQLADLCTVDVVEVPGEAPRLVAVAAVDPRLEELLHETDGYLPRQSNPKTMIGKALATGETVLAPRVTEEHLRRISVCDEQAEAYLAMRLVSGLVAPLVARGQVLGAVSLFTSAVSGRVYDESDAEVVTELGRRAGLSIDNARLYTREHEAAETLQRSLLPELPEVPGLDVAARYLPASAHAGVGGDLFDLFPLPDDAIALAIGDVMGHDMQAAAAMGQLRSVLRSYAWEGAPPGAVLDRMDLLVQHFRMAQLATAVYARLELSPDGGALLRYANAGHLPPLLQHPDGSVRFLHGGQSVVIGAPSVETRPEATEAMPPGSTLLLYTDGLLEVNHQSLDDGLDKLFATVRGHDPASGAEALCAAVEATIAGENLVDDVALLAVRLL